LAEFLVSAALLGGVVLCPAWVPVAAGAFLPFSAALVDARGRNSTRPRRLLS
jgi:hypothetical protein